MSRIKYLLTLYQGVHITYFNLTTLTTTTKTQKYYATLYLGLQARRLTRAGMIIYPYFRAIVNHADPWLLTPLAIS